MVGEVGEHAVVAAVDFSQLIAGIDWSAIFHNKIARAVGMLVIVWLTIWVIALVYSGYTRDSDLGPIAFRPHTNRRLGDGTIVFDQTKYPFQMQGVEATCTFFYNYEGHEGAPKKIPLIKRRLLTLNIRSSLIPRDANTRFGFEGPDDLPSGLVRFPVIDNMGTGDTVQPTPETVGEYVAHYKLIEKWTDDDQAPVVSVGNTLWEEITGERSDHIRERARLLKEAQDGHVFQRMSVGQLSRERANVFGSYFIKMQFSKNPWFVLFRHPNQDLKMTAWVTVLTSVFALAMDAWPVK